MLGCNLIIIGTANSPKIRIFPRVSAAQTSANIDRIPIIARLVNLISLISNEDFLHILLLPESSYTKTILKRAIGGDLSSTILAWPDVNTVLRMFWLTKIAHDTMSGWSVEDFMFYKSTPEAILHLNGISEADKDMLKGFVDLEAIMVNIYAYRSVLFYANAVPTESTLIHPSPYKSVPPTDFNPHGKQDNSYSATVTQVQGSSVPFSHGGGDKIDNDGYSTSVLNSRPVFRYPDEGKEVADYKPLLRGWENYACIAIYYSQGYILY